MKDIIVLNRKSLDDTEYDFVQKRICEMFGEKRLLFEVYSNEDWTFYKYSKVANKKHGEPILMMTGMSLVRNGTHECSMAVTEKPSESSERIYMAVIEDYQALWFKTVERPVDFKEKLKRF